MQSQWQAVQGTKLHRNKGVLDIWYWDTQIRVPIQVLAPIMGTCNMRAGTASTWIWPARRTQNANGEDQGYRFRLASNSKMPSAQRIHIHIQDWEK